MTEKHFSPCPKGKKIAPSIMYVKSPKDIGIEFIGKWTMEVSRLDRVFSKIQLLYLSVLEVNNMINEAF